MVKGLWLLAPLTQPSLCQPCTHLHQYPPRSRSLFRLVWLNARSAKLYGAEIMFLVLSVILDMENERIREMRLSVFNFHFVLSGPKLFG